MKPKLPVPTRTQEVAMMWDAAEHVHNACEEVDRLFTRNCLLFELGAMSDEEMGDVMREVNVLCHISDGLEMLDLDPAERARVEQESREFLRLVPGTAAMTRGGEDAMKSCYLLGLSRSQIIREAVLEFVREHQQHHDDGE